MNIDKVKGCAHPKQFHTDRKAEGKKRFEQILNNAVDSVAREEHNAGEVSPVKGVELPASWGPGHVEHLVFKQAYTILNLLEEYSKALNNPHMTLKGIEPIVTRIEQELKGLDVQSIDNLGQNHELVRIINDIAVTAGVETIKFQRGDYVP